MTLRTDIPRITHYLRNASDLCGRGPGYPSLAACVDGALSEALTLQADIERADTERAEAEAEDHVQRRLDGR